MKDFDKANMVAMFDDALTKLIKYIEEDKPEIARFKALEVREKFRKVVGYLGQEGGGSG
jgi:hypothetical protein